MIVWGEVRTERMASRGTLDVREVRARVRRMLADALAGAAGSVDLADVDLMVCEIVTNAIRHSDSGKPGGGVRVTLLVSRHRLRLEVQDDGSSGGPPVIAARDAGWSESGRGLTVLNGLADRWGALPCRSTVWFEVLR